MPEVLISTFLRWIQLAHNAQICSPASTAKTAQSALLQQILSDTIHFNNIPISQTYQCMQWDF